MENELLLQLTEFILGKQNSLPDEINTIGKILQYLKNRSIISPYVFDNSGRKLLSYYIVDQISAHHANTLPNSNQFEQVEYGVKVKAITLNIDLNSVVYKIPFTIVVDCFCNKEEHLREILKTNYYHYSIQIKMSYLDKDMHNFYLIEKHIKALHARSCKISIIPILDHSSNDFSVNLIHFINTNIEYIDKILLFNKLDLNNYYTLKYFIDNNEINGVEKLLSSSKVIDPTNKFLADLLNSLANI